MVSGCHTSFMSRVVCCRQASQLVVASSSSGELPGPQPFVTEGQTRKEGRGVGTENKGGEKRRRLVNVDGSQKFLDYLFIYLFDSDHKDSYSQKDKHTDRQTKKTRTDNSNKHYRKLTHSRADCHYNKVTGLKKVIVQRNIQRQSRCFSVCERCRFCKDAIISHQERSWSNTFR